ncbi:MAG: hypothetical protein JO257_08255 [Deltaproteobacteria bacterium]|nr:hypothetical protein [Deltaproteobacteria bacterium]
MGYSIEMRALAVILIASVGCSTTSYKIPATELQRLAATPPEQRGAHVRVTQMLSNEDLGPEYPVETQTQIIIFPEVNVYGPYERRRYYNYGGTTGGGGNIGASGGRSVSNGTPSSGGGSSGKAGDGKAEAIAVLVIAATALVVAAAIEGSRFDGYAQVHPMVPVHLFGRDGGYTVLPLAWIDPQTAQWADHGIVRSTEGPWNELERAPLDRVGWTYAMFGGLGSFKSADGSVQNGTATTIQLGYFPDQKIGILGNIFFGWRDNAANATLFESRYTLEVQGYPVVAGPLHLGLYGGGGEAYRWEDGIAGGNAGSLALQGGAMLQLDFNTRLALTARLGQTYAHDERMSDLMLGLCVY